MIDSGSSYTVSIAASGNGTVRATIVAGAEVWTATTHSGNYAGGSCSDFNSNSSSAPYAYVAISDSSTSQTNRWFGPGATLAFRAARAYHSFWLQRGIVVRARWPGRARLHRLPVRSKLSRTA